MSEGIARPEQCPLGALHDQRLTGLEKRMDQMQILIEKVRNRLPLWATILFMVMSALLGVLGTLLSAHPTMAPIVSSVDWPLFEAGSISCGVAGLLLILRGLCGGG